MPADAPTDSANPSGGVFSRLFHWWHHTPLYLRILGGVILGVVVGLAVSHGVRPLVDAILPPDPEPVSVIPLAGFDSDGEPEIRVMADGSLYVVFNFMPPSWAEGDAAFGDFDQQLAKAVGLPVVWEDREFFRIERPANDTVERIRRFVENYRLNKSSDSGGLTARGTKTQEAPQAAERADTGAEAGDADKPPPKKLTRGEEWAAQILFLLETPSKLVLRLLGALAAPLILLAVIQALMHAQLPRGSGLRLFGLLLLNTVVAILVGLTVANVMQPGRWTSREVQEPPAKAAGPKNPLELFIDNIPKSVLGPLADEGKVIAVIILAVAFGIALRRLKDHPIRNVTDAVEVGFRSLITILHWIIEVIPLAVFGIVAAIIGREGFTAFVNLGAFVVAVLVALALQTTYYLVRIRLGSWASPWHVLKGVRDALVMAFSTASSTATMPVTYAALRQNVGLRERSASLGALVGANFNNDGTALYEAMAALFISQLIGQDLSFDKQVLVVLTSIIASVGAAGIPEAGLVTMTLVFTAVGLPTRFIAILLTVDWFLDRCRTAVNVLGDVNVSCMLDGREREVGPERFPTEELGELLDEPEQPEMVGPTELTEPPTTNK